jgi:hypothetical protein
VDRFVIAGLTLRFWWVVAGCGAAVSAWLLATIARSIS